MSDPAPRDAAGSGQDSTAERAHEVIRVLGARQNNLQDISIEIPKRRLTAVSYTHLTLPTILLV